MDDEVSLGSLIKAIGSLIIEEMTDMYLLHIYDTSDREKQKWRLPYVEYVKKLKNLF